MLVLVAAAAAAQVTALPTLPWDAYPADTRAAIEPAYKTAAARPLDAAATGALARTLQAWRELEAAHRTYGRAQALAPGTFEWHYLDGIVLQKLARHAEAATQFRRALLISSGYLPAEVRLAESLLTSGQLDESEPLFEALVSEPPTEPLAEFGLGRIAAARGQHDLAVTHLERALRLFPEWGEAYYALAMSLRALGRRDEAAAALASHARFGITVPGLEDPILAGTAALRDDAVAHLERGVNLKIAGDLAGAIAAHEAAIAREPSYAQAHVNLISLFTEARDWAKVEAHYRAAVALGFGLAGANLDYGMAQERQGHWDLAEAAYRRAVAVNPEHAGARVSLGRMLERRKDFEAAAAEYRLALASQPTHRVARYDLARMLTALGRPLEAIAEFERVIEPRDESTPAVLLGLAAALARVGRHTEAAGRLAEARALAVDYQRQDLIDLIDRVTPALTTPKAER